MTKGQSQFFRFFLFLLGAGIIALAFYLTTDGDELTDIDKFMWVSISAMYLFLFLPFFFSVIKTNNKCPSSFSLFRSII